MSGAAPVETRAARTARLRGEFRQLHALGLHLFPVGLDKRPFEKWKNGPVDYVETPASIVEGDVWAADSRTYGWANLCGNHAAGVFTLDVEVAGMDYAEISGAFDALPASCQRSSPSGGRHAVIRVVGEPVATVVLAFRAGVLLAETRGVSPVADRAGAYAVITGPGRGPLPADFRPHELPRSVVDSLLDMIRGVDDGSGRAAVLTFQLPTLNLSSAVRPLRCNQSISRLSINADTSANSGPTPTTRSPPPDSSDPSDIHSEAHSTSHAPIIRELLPRAFPRPLFLKYHLPWTGSHPPKPSRRDRRIENRTFQNLRPSSISSRIPFRPGFVFARTLRASSIQFSPAFSSPFFGPTKRATTFPLRVITTSCPPATRFNKSDSLFFASNAPIDKLAFIHLAYTSSCLLQTAFRIQTPYSPPVASALRQSKIKDTNPLPLPVAGALRSSARFTETERSRVNPLIPNLPTPYFEIVNPPVHRSFALRVSLPLGTSTFAPTYTLPSCLARVASNWTDSAIDWFGANDPR